MKRYLALVCMVGVIPLAGILISSYVQHHFDSQFEEAVTRRYGERGVEALRTGQASLSGYCNSADGADEPTCDTYRHVGVLKYVSALALLVGFALLIGIHLAARIASTNRSVLLTVFSPGIKVVLAVLFGLIIVQGAIATYGAYILEAVAIHRIHLILIAGVGLGALAGAFTMIKAGFSVSQRASVAVLGVTSLESTEPELWHFVRDIASRLGANPPGSIVVGLQPSFYVTSADVEVYPSRDKGRSETLYLSLPLMRILSREELAAVVGHELGHFRGEDTRYSIMFYPIYAGTVHALAALRGSGQGSQGLALLPAVAILSFFMDRFAVAERTLGRDRELEADKAGASVSSPRALGVALLKVGAFAPLWKQTVFELANAIQDAQPFSNAGSHYATSAKTSAKPELLADVLGFAATHPTDTHPATGVRIQALGLSVDDLRDEALSVNLEQSSAQLFADPVQLDEALTTIQRKALVEMGVTERLRPARPVNVAAREEESAAQALDAKPS